MGRLLLRLAIAVVLAASAYLLYLRLLTPAPIEVAVIEAARGRVEATVTNSRAGTVKARRRAKLSPEIGGTVVALPRAEGEAVRAGEVLLRLDDSLQRARLAVAERDLQAAAAEVRRVCQIAERAERELERIRGLVPDGIVSADRLDQVESSARAERAACAAAQAAAARARAAVDLQRAELAKTVLKAPFDGIVAELATEIGEYVTPAPPAVPVPPVIDVLDPSSIYVSAPMDEVDAGRLARGLEARVSVDSHRGQTFAGRVRRIAPYVLDREEQNRTVEIEVELDDRDLARSLLPGTSADVEVILERRDGVLRLPTSSLIEGRQVLVLDGGVLRATEVEVGLRNWDYFEVRSGLAEGARVVASIDRAEVRDGVRAVARDGAATAP